MYIFFIYFVEDCRLDKLLKGWRKSWQPNILLFKAALFLANGYLVKLLFCLDLIDFVRGKGELQAVSMNKIHCCRSETHLYT